MWNRKLNQWAIVTYDQMKGFISSARHRGIKTFESDGNRYYELEWKWFTDHPTTRIGHATP